LIHNQMRQPLQSSITDRPLFRSKRRPHFKTHYVCGPEQKYSLEGVRSKTDCAGEDQQINVLLSLSLCSTPNFPHLPDQPICSATRCFSSVQR
jgi:hypothetical protein